MFSMSLQFSILLIQMFGVSLLNTLCIKMFTVFYTSKSYVPRCLLYLNIQQIQMCFALLHQKRLHIQMLGLSLLRIAFCIQMFIVSTVRRSSVNGLR